MNGTPIELNIENSVDFLKRFVDLGYRTGTVSIKDGAIISKWFRVLKGLEKDPELNSEIIYNRIIKLIENFNVAKAYGLDDAAVIDKVISFVQENQLKKVEEEKIKEL